MQKHKQIPVTVLKIARVMLKEYVTFEDGELEKRLTGIEPTPEKIFYTYKEAADILLISKRHLQTLIQRYGVKVYMANSRTPRLNMKMILSLADR